MPDIDPATGERVQSAQIDPQTGERIGADTPSTPRQDWRDRLLAHTTPLTSDQAAKVDRLNTMGQPSVPGLPANHTASGLADTALGAANAVGTAVLHPLDTLMGTFHVAKDAVTLPISSEGKAAGDRTAKVLSNAVQGFKDNAPYALGQQLGGAALGEGVGAVAAKAAPAVGRFVRKLPDMPARAAAKVIAPVDALDRVLPGDTVTARQRYGDAKAMGVNLDTAQATDGKLAVAGKRLTEHSLAGSGKFADNATANVAALQAKALSMLDEAHPEAVSQEAFGDDLKGLLTDHKAHLEAEADLPGQANTLLDGITPDKMSREDFGNAAKTALQQHQELLSGKAGAIFDDLSSRNGAVRPDISPVRDQAQKIMADNKGYYENNPEMLAGQQGRAWSIVNRLAKEPEPPVPPAATPPVLDGAGQPTATATPPEIARGNSWTDLHKLRSDLMNMYRSPDIVGTNAQGWLKQLTGKVDDSMTGAASGLSPADEAQFRTANDLYTKMKQTYDNPQSKLYHVVRAEDGLTAANSLSNITPTVAGHIRMAANDLGMPELHQQLQRQTTERLLDPSGNGAPDMQGLPSRFGKAQKEQMGGVLHLDHIAGLSDLAEKAGQKGVYEDPKSDAYKILQAKDGMAATKAALAAGPEGIRQIGKAAKTMGRGEIVPQLQRQAMDHIVSPAGNDLSDLKNLPSRFAKTGKEQLRNLLTAEQVDDLEKLSRTSKVVHADSNASGSGKVIQAAAEGGGLVSGAGTMLAGIATGNPGLVAAGATPFAEAGATRLIASKMTRPEFTDAMVNPPADLPPATPSAEPSAFTVASAAPGMAAQLARPSASMQAASSAAPSEPADVAPTGTESAPAAPAADPPDQAPTQHATGTYARMANGDAAKFSYYNQEMKRGRAVTTDGRNIPTLKGSDATPITEAEYNDAKEAAQTRRRLKSAKLSAE